MIFRILHLYKTSLQDYILFRQYIHLIFFITGGRPCDVCDVAINSNYFHEKVLKSNYSKMFVMTVAVEGVASKYNINFTQDNGNLFNKTVLIYL